MSFEFSKTNMILMINYMFILFCLPFSEDIIRFFWMLRHNTLMIVYIVAAFAILAIIIALFWIYKNRFCDSNIHNNTSFMTRLGKSNLENDNHTWCYLFDVWLIVVVRETLVL